LCIINFIDFFFSFFVYLGKFCSLIHFCFAKLFYMFSLFFFFFFLYQKF
jgi:hypothetical protein